MAVLLLNLHTLTFATRSAHIDFGVAKLALFMLHDKSADNVSSLPKVHHNMAEELTFQNFSFLPDS